MPHWDIYVLNSSEEKEVALSESTKLVAPHNVNTLPRHCITVKVLISLHAKAKGKQEYLSIIINKYLLGIYDGNKPLKLMLICFISPIAYKLPCSLQTKNSRT